MNKVVSDLAVKLVPDPRSALYHSTVFQKDSHLVYAMTRRGFPGAGVFAGAEGRPQRAELARQLGIELENTVWLDPASTGPIRFFSEADGGCGGADWNARLQGAAGMVTDALNLYLCTLYNDNVVVALFDPRRYGVGLINIAPSQTTDSEVAHAVQLLVERTGAAPGELEALIGPSVGPCCRTFPDPNLAGGRGLSNLWDLARGALLKAGIHRSRIFNPRVCTACSDTEFHTRLVDGPNGGVGAMVFGIRDDGSLRSQLNVRRGAAKAKPRPAAAAPEAESLTDEEKRLNRLIRCPHGHNKVYVRSVFDGQSAETSKPHIALRCAVMEHVGQAAGGYNIVLKDYIEAFCCADYVNCEAYQEFLRRTHEH